MGWVVFFFFFCSFDGGWFVCLFDGFGSLFSLFMWCLLLFLYVLERLARYPLTIIRFLLSSLLSGFHSMHSRRSVALGSFFWVEWLQGKMENCSARCLRAPRWNSLNYMQRAEGSESKGLSAAAQSKSPADPGEINRHNRQQQMLAEKVLEQSKHTDISLGRALHIFVCSILHQNIISTPFCLIALEGVLFHLSKRFLIFLPINIQPVLLEGIPSF